MEKQHYAFSRRAIVFPRKAGFRSWTRPFLPFGVVYKQMQPPPKSALWDHYGIVTAVETKGFSCSFWVQGRGPHPTAWVGVATCLSLANETRAGVMLSLQGHLEPESEAPHSSPSSLTTEEVRVRTEAPSPGFPGSSSKDSASASPHCAQRV